MISRNLRIHGSSFAASLVQLGAQARFFAWGIQSFIILLRRVLLAGLSLVVWWRLTSFPHEDGKEGARKESWVGRTRHHQILQNEIFGS